MYDRVLSSVPNLFSVDRGGRAPPPPTSSVFSGSGHTLGSDDVPSSVVPDPNAGGTCLLPSNTHLTNIFKAKMLPSVTSPSGAMALRSKTANSYSTTTRTILKSCLRFTLGNTIQCITSALITVLQPCSNAPPSILNIRVGQEVEVRIDKRTGEDYVEPKGVRTFTGSGQRLGAPVPSVTSEGGSAAAMPGSFPSSSDASTTSLPPRESMTTRFEVDQNLPTTSVQIRLADGTRYADTALSSDVT
jgi:SEP domain